MNVHRWNEMNRAAKERLLRRSETDIMQFVEQVKPIVEDVRKNGDAAVIRWTEKFDGVLLKSNKFKATPAEFAAAKKQLSAAVRNAIEKAAANVRKYHERQMPQSLWLTPMEPGVYAGEKITPVASCGLYVPRGKGSFPSVMIMLGAPAVVAGVERIVAVTPPGPNGEVDAATLVAAEACGVKDVYRIGGVQAVASLAYGTAKIPKVDKIIGPGSGYVTAAKRLLYGVVDVGLPAGPSESIILADENADPELVALDLLIEQEHGPDSTALLVTHSEALIKKVMARLPGLIKRLPEKRRNFIKQGFANFGGAVLTRDLEQSIEFVNLFAPEHLEVLTAQPFEALEKIKNAGEILLGPDTPITLGNFNLGIDAILPTGGFAKSFSGVSVYDFLKRSSIGYVTPQGFKSLAPSAETLARYEGFPAHAMAVADRRKRIAKNGKKK
jgi:histidinol dehydrogenase